MLTLLNDDFREVLPRMEQVRMVFADPPDNINLDYGEYKDQVSERGYFGLLQDIIWIGTGKAEVVWISYNATHTYLMGYLLYCFLEDNPEWEAKPNVQVFTFGQHNQHDLGNNHRPLARLMRKGTTLYPDAIRVPSWRQLHGDRRADPRGRVPGDMFDFPIVQLCPSCGEEISQQEIEPDVYNLPRVVGNSRQRRRWHPTQLNEGLYERCIRLTCKPTDTVCDIFAGTGTLARVCIVTGNPCVLIDIDAGYCEKIAEEHKLVPVFPQEWRSE